MDDSPTDGFRHHPLWLLGVAAVVLAQTGLALGLFGPERAPAAVADDRPVLSGRHPLHLYHGTLGAETFRDRGATACYDPAFQAGYPKTPVFDGGCRPAELVLVLAGGGFHPAAYKVGLFACLVAFPLVFVVAGRGAGLPAGAAVLAGVFGLALSWSGPVRAIVEEGDVDVLLAGLAAVVFVSWLAHYARWPGAQSWLALAGASAVGWFAHPLIWAGMVPILVAYYVVFAPRQGLGWHLGLLGVATAGFAPNAWWLADWGRYWWLRQPSPADHIPLPDWPAVLGCPADYTTLCGCVPCGGMVVVAGLAGLVVMFAAGRRTAAGLLFVGAALTVVVARIAAAWPRVPADVADRVVPLAAGFLALPAAFALWAALARVGVAGFATVLAVAATLVVGWADAPGRPLATSLRLHTDPLVIGFTADQEQVLAALRDHTTAEARILWDETTDHRPGWNWSALLPVFTNRAYLGGLDPDAGMEHGSCGLRDGRLNGRPLADCSDDDLATFCRWYNVGWVVCRCPAAIDRWGHFPGAAPVARLKEGGQPVVLFALDRPRSFVLVGSAVWDEATPRRVSLTDVVPDAGGAVELSLHHIDGLRVYPSYIHLAAAPDPTGADPIKHVRLQLPGPVPRVTLVWENP